MSPLKIETFEDGSRSTDIAVRILDDTRPRYSAEDLLLIGLNLSIARLTNGKWRLSGGYSSIFEANIIFGQSQTHVVVYSVDIGKNTAAVEIKDPKNPKLARRISFFDL